MLRGMRERLEIMYFYPYSTGRSATTHTLLLHVQPASWHASHGAPKDHLAKRHHAYLALQTP